MLFSKLGTLPGRRAGRQALRAGDDLTEFCTQGELPIGVKKYFEREREREREEEEETTAVEEFSPTTGMIRNSLKLDRD